MRLPASVLIALVLLALPAALSAQVQRDAPIGAYPSGSTSEGKMPLGAYPPSRPAPVVRPPDATGPVQTDERAEYCRRNPEVCNVREPDAHDMIIDRQKAFEQRMRETEEEINRTRTNRP